MVSKQHLKAIQETLEQERLRLLERLGMEPAEVAVNTANSGPAASRTLGDLAGRDRSIAVNSVERNMLEQIEAAIARIAAGDYGTCEQCGKPINPERLEAVPYATLCIACQSASDA